MLFFCAYPFNRPTDSAKEARIHGPREVGLTLIGIGIFALIIAGVQHWQFMKKLRPDQPYKPWDLSFIVAILIGLLGLAMFVSMILRAGPLG